jgi:structural toxin protein (hemagglutinin/hemolysin) RtxA
MQYQMESFLISYYVPESHLEITKEALFKAGSGFFGLYDKACWQIKGTGQYRTLEGANPFHGTTDAISIIDEYKVEIMCTKEHLTKSIEALLESHPYEVPVYQVFPIFSV